jgi:hypothetical protein
MRFYCKRKELERGLRSSRCNPSTDKIKDGFGILSLPSIFFLRRYEGEKKLLRQVNYLSALSKPGTNIKGKKI